MTNAFVLAGNSLDNERYNHLARTWHRDENTKKAFYEFFGAAIRNENTRVAYLYGIRSFFQWTESLGVTDEKQIDPLLVSRWVDEQLQIHSIPTANQRLSALKMLFDHLIMKKIVDRNPVLGVRRTKYSMRQGRTPYLTAVEARNLLESIDTGSPKGFRDRALIALMTFTFARVGAALKLKTTDLFWQDGRLWVRLSEKGGRVNAIPCHHKLELWMQEHLAQSVPSAINERFVFTTIDRKTKQLSDRPLSQSNVYMMVKKRAKEAGIKTDICNHTFRATGITAFLENNGTLERAALIANHASTRTTQLYDRRSDQILQGDVEKVQI